MSIDLKNKKIAVLMGGPGSERKVSLAAGAGVAPAMRSLAADVTEVDVGGPDFVVPAGTAIAVHDITGPFGDADQLQHNLA